MKKRIEQWEIRSHGIDNPDYFQGCGTAFTVFDDAVTGIGDSEYSALQDALECAAQSEWDTESLESDSTFVGEMNTMDKKEIECGGEEDNRHWYVTILLKQLVLNTLPAQPVSILHATCETAESLWHIASHLPWFCNHLWVCPVPDCDGMPEYWIDAYSLLIPLLLDWQRNNPLPKGIECLAPNT